MRCSACNVDLGDEYKRCPLCGTEATCAEPVIKGFKTAEYPKESPECPSDKAHEARPGLSRARLKAFFTP